MVHSAICSSLTSAMASYRIPGEWMKDDMVLMPAIKKEVIEGLETFEMKEGDVLIGGYPKTGTTWVQEMVWLICNNGDTNKARQVLIKERIPHIEYKHSNFLSNFEKLQNGSHPLVMKTHLRSETFHRQIAAGKMKTIICIRNPKDTLVSFYHFYRMNAHLGNFTGSWNDFFELYKAKHLFCGDYFKWYSSWLQHKDKPNVKLVKYEDMHTRMLDVIEEVSVFLDKSLPRDIIDDVIDYLSFNRMSQNDMVNYSNFYPFDKQISPFIRKGIVGDWKNYFSSEQAALVEKAYKDIIQPLGVKLEFE